METRKWALVAVCAGASACGWSEVTPPTEEPDQAESTAAAANVRYSATVQNIVIQRGIPPFIAILRIENTGRQAVTLTYPAACPVRIRLYREVDTVRVYDETLRPCSAATATLRLAPGGSWDIGSGVRYPSTVAGDSIPAGSYIVRVVPETAHADVEVVAGIFLLAGGG